MCGHDRAHGFVLDEHTSFDEHIGCKFTDDDTAILHTEPLATFDRHADVPQLYHQGILVHRFQKSRPKRSMHPHCRANH